MMTETNDIRVSKMTTVTPTSLVATPPRPLSAIGKPLAQSLSPSSERPAAK